MSTSRLELEDLFTLAREVNTYSASMHRLLGEAAPVTEYRALRCMSDRTYEVTRDNATFQDKLQISYGL